MPSTITTAVASGSSRASSRGATTPVVLQGHSADSSPSNRSASGTPSSIGSSSKPKPKPVNIFSNDGSFLERFQRMQKEDEEKRKRDEELRNKLNFEDRFKKRGKRRAASSEPPETAEPSTDELPVKKVKTDTEPGKPLTAYEKEVKSYSGNGNLKDQGMGIRPLVK